MSFGFTPDCSQIRETPFKTPIEESSGVDGTFAVNVEPSDSLINKKSVKVPPTSTPKRYDI